MSIGGVASARSAEHDLGFQLGLMERKTPTQPTTSVTHSHERSKTGRLDTCSSPENAIQF